MPKKGTPSCIKNEYRFELLIMNNKNSFKDYIFVIREAMELPTKIRTESLYGNPKLLKEKCNDINTKRASFLKSCSKEKIRDLSSCIDKILKDNDLGEEWFTPVADLIISGYLYPPAYNLFVRTDLKNKRVSIELNMTTTLEDIKEAWKDSIKKEMAKVFGETKQVYFGKKTGERLLLGFRDIATAKEEFDYAENKLNKLSDSDLAERFLGKANKKTINRLRQVRKRIRKKI